MSQDIQIQELQTSALNQNITAEILTNDILNSMDVKRFNVEKPNVLKFIILFFPLYLLQFAVYPTNEEKSINIIYILLILGITLPFFWHYFGSEQVMGSFIRMIERKKQNKRPHLFDRLMGTYLDPKLDYYIDPNANSLNANSIVYLLKDKLIELFSITIGLSIIVDEVVGYFFLVEAPNLLTKIITPVLFMPISLILVCRIMPLIWVTGDLNINIIDDNDEIKDINDQLRSSVLSRFFGLTGIVLLYNRVNDYMLNGMESDFITEYLVLPFNVFFLLVYLMIYIPIPLFAGLFYFKYKHEILVNSVREYLITNDVLPVRKLKWDEKRYTDNHPLLVEKKNQLLSIANKPKKRSNTFMFILILAIFILILTVYDSVIRFQNTPVTT
jgi:hypothetical protein